MKKRVFFIFTFLILNSLQSQVSTDIVSGVGIVPTKPLPSLKSFTVSGYYRFITNYRHLNYGYSEQMKTPNQFFVGDDGQIPQLSLNIGGSTAQGTRFSTDLYIWTPLTGQGQSENVKGLNLGVSLTGTHDFDFGTLNIIAGGINWYALSPFTFFSNPGYNRYMLFERNPWDPLNSGISDRYEQYYNVGAINQDNRWGRQAFQGVITELKNLPRNMELVFMAGKTQLNGGFSPIPNQSFGGKIKHQGKRLTWSLNSFNNLSNSDSLNTKTTGFNIHTTEINLKSKICDLQAEIGLGQYFSQTYHKGFGEAVDVKLNFQKTTGFPFVIRLFQISPKVINNSSIFWNSSIREGNQSSSQSSDQLVLVPFSSAMAPIGQLANNRRGIELNAEHTLFKKLKLSWGIHNSKELEKISSQITYSHPVNNLAVSRFWRWGFPSQVGPYQNLNKVYRGYYETLNLIHTDKTGKPIDDKYFSSIEMNLKYRTKFMGKSIFINYLGTFASVQNFYSPITVLTEKSYLRTYYHQLEGYIQINKRLIWTNYIGWERLIANYETEVNPLNRRPKNQENFGVASGFDIEMSKNTCLFLRQRWMQYGDRNFNKDKFQGYETSVELKIVF